MSYAAGDRVGRLVLVRYVPKRKGVVSHQQWLCRCDCGRETTVHVSSMRRGLTASCGCLQRARTVAANTRHGHARRLEKHSPAYRSWAAAKARCTNPRDGKWKDYGGRGITMCARWRRSFTAFLDDMGTRPTGTSLDRYPDNDGNYEPGNCRWATPLEQRHNQRRTKKGTR